MNINVTFVGLGALALTLTVAAPGCGDDGLRSSADLATLADAGAADAAIFPRPLFVAPPTDWSAGNADDQAHYDFGEDSAVLYGGQPTARARYIGAVDGGAAPAPDSWGVWVSSHSARGIAGKRIRMRAMMKTDSVGVGSSIWLRLDGTDGWYALDNGTNPKDRRLKGTHDWTEVASVLQVPDETTVLMFGALQFGAGTTWIADVRFEEVSPDEPETPHVSRAP